MKKPLKQAIFDLREKEDREDIEYEEYCVNHEILHIGPTFGSHKHNKILQ